MSIEFSDEGIQRLAEIAYHVNENTENIGARRLHTVMERLLEEVSFNASENAGQMVRVDVDFVNDRLGDLSQDQDLSQYIL